MAANGVIGITASILESSDIPESENNPENQKPFFERIKLWVKGLSKNWKGMVKKGATVGFYALLAGSKIMQGITKSMFGIVGALIDVLLAPLIPFISKGINWLADIVRAVGDFIKNMPETFKKIWNPIWNWITKLVSSAGSTLMGLFDAKGKEKLSGSERDKEVAKVIGSDKGPIVTDTERDGFLDGTGSEEDAHLIDEPINQEDVDEERDRIQKHLEDELPTQEEVTAVQQSYEDAATEFALPSETEVEAAKDQWVTALQDQFQLPSETEVEAIKESYADAVEEHLTLPSQTEVTVAQDSYVEAMEIPPDKLEEAVYGEPTWMDDDPDAPANPPEGPINQFHVQTAVDAGEIVGLSDEDAEDFGKETMDKWYNSWINHVPEFNLEEMLTEFLPDEWDPVGAVTNLFSGGKSVEREAIAQELVNSVVQGPKAPPPSIFDPIGPDTIWDATNSSSLGTIDPADRAFAEAMMLELYLMSKK